MMLVTDRFNTLHFIIEMRATIPTDTCRQKNVVSTLMLIQPSFKVLSLLGSDICYEVVMMDCVYLCFCVFFVIYVRKL